MSRAEEDVCMYGQYTPICGGSGPLRDNIGLDFVYFGSKTYVGNSVVTDVQFGHLFLVCIKYVASQEVTCGLFRNISYCS